MSLVGVVTSVDRPGVAIVTEEFIHDVHPDALRLTLLHLIENGVRVIEIEPDTRVAFAESEGPRKGKR